MALTARGDFAAVKLQHRPPHVLRDSIQAPQSAHDVPTDAGIGVGVSAQGQCQGLHVLPHCVKQLKCKQQYFDHPYMCKRINATHLIAVIIAVAQQMHGQSEGVLGMADVRHALPGGDSHALAILHPGCNCVNMRVNRLHTYLSNVSHFPGKIMEICCALMRDWPSPLHARGGQQVHKGLAIHMRVLQCMHVGASKFTRNKPSLRSSAVHMHARTGKGSALVRAPKQLCNQPMFTHLTRILSFADTHLGAAGGVPVLHKTRHLRLGTPAGQQGILQHNIGGKVGKEHIEYVDLMIIQLGSEAHLPQCRRRPKLKLLGGKPFEELCFWIYEIESFILECIWVQSEEAGGG
eukprot:scaffold120143_cov20-Tisochrysis_lutea.AAC.1